MVVLVICEIKFLLLQYYIVINLCTIGVSENESLDDFRLYMYQYVYNKWILFIINFNELRCNVILQIHKQTSI